MCQTISKFPLIVASIRGNGGSNDRDNNGACTLGSSGGCGRGRGINSVSDLKVIHTSCDVEVVTLLVVIVGSNHCDSNSSNDSSCYIYFYLYWRILSVITTLILIVIVVVIVDPVVLVIVIIAKVGIAVVIHIFIYSG